MVSSSLVFKNTKSWLFLAEEYFKTERKSWITSKWLCISASFPITVKCIYIEKTFLPVVISKKMKCQ